MSRISCNRFHEIPFQSGLISSDVRILCIAALLFTYIAVKQLGAWCAKLVFRGCSVFTKTYAFWLLFHILVESFLVHSGVPVSYFMDCFIATQWILTNRSVSGISGKK